MAGGAQVNGIELCEALRNKYGHQPVLFGTPGPMVEVAKAKDIPYIPAPVPKMRPSIRRSIALERAVSDLKPDLLHAKTSLPFQRKGPPRRMRVEDQP